MSSTRAQLSQPFDTRWYLFVVAPGVRVADWPSYAWPDGSPIPTPADRLAALAGLGYRPVPGVEWEWTEVFPAAEPTDDISAVSLLAALAVQPAGGDQQ